MLLAPSQQTHRPVRHGVGLYDLTSMGKFMVQGRDAEAVLQNICTNDIGGPAGSVSYTPVVNERGGFETDITVTKVDDETFFIVTAAGTPIRDLDYIKRRIPKDAVCTIIDVTHGYSMLAVMGPKARDLMADLSDADFSNEAFPFSTAQDIDLAYTRCMAVRMSYVGELGWELYIPTNHTLAAFDTIMEKGKKHGLKLVGMQAVNSLRLETGYRHWESDITPDDNPYEAGLGFGVKLDKDDFIGKEALMTAKQKPLARKMAMFTLEDPDIMLYGNEPIYRDGEYHSILTSGGYGFEVGAAVGMGYLKNPEGVTADWMKAGKYELMVEGELRAATLHISSPYDPKNQRTKM